MLKMLLVNKPNIPKNGGKPTLSKILLFLGLLSLIFAIILTFAVSPSLNTELAKANLVQSGILVFPLTALLFLGSIAAKLQDW